ncbi:type VI secretion system contractile sheath large subunit [Marivita sp. S6314]|uniref:type VI secretion system contractile sheath domain-containing protein n=1 Tax=Marivita sp. S6314 TaxID=2926406 RepID=UPI001FF6469E|nr:type VI secretion system contractile sheath large subunit [Marivita sp. S6314]MCK0150044.1 type VI secretion system contractile sheath large subunit [Marivita sp. S6314]
MTNPLQFSVEYGKANPKARPSAGQPLRILLISDLGDSSASRSTHSLETRPIRNVDIDSFDSYLGSEAPSIDLDAGTLQMRDIEEFHPDQICQSLPVFQTLRDLKYRLRDPSSFDAATQDVQAMLHATDTSDETPSAPEADTDTFSRLLGTSTGSPAEQPSSPSRSGFLNSLLHDAVAAHITADTDPKAEQYVDAVDAAAAAHLRAVLHDPGFQALEAAWRGLHLLVSNMDSDEDVALHVLNASQAELLDALGSSDDPVETSVLHKRLVAERADAPFTLIVLDSLFTPSAEDVRLLASLGAFAGRTGGAVLSSVAPDMLGAASWGSIATASDTAIQPNDGWEVLRQTPMAGHIVATAPRFMMRTPYGRKLDPIDAFPFEEITDPASDQAPFLWGGASLLTCCLIAQSFQQEGWSARLNANLTFDDLPFVPFDAGGEQQMKPGAETTLPDRAATVVQAQGIVPLLASRNQNAVRLPWLQTIATTNAGAQIGPFST